MRATIMHAAGDVRVEDVPDPAIEQSTDVVLRTVLACVCGSDLHPYHSKPAEDPPAPMGHELLGVVEEVGADVATLRRGDLVVAPFAYSDNTCEFCQEGLHTSCLHGGFWTGINGGQGEAVRMPQADGTLVKLGVAEDSGLLPSLLTLADVYPTGYHAAVAGGVNERTSVTVIGDGAVGLLAVLSARQLGAEQIILMGRHRDRTDLGRRFGATDVVAERGEEGIERVRELTRGGQGTHVVLEAVGLLPALEQAFGVVRSGGTISRVGVPQYGEAPLGANQFMHNVTVTGGIAPVRHYIEPLLPGVLNGEVDPGAVFDRTMKLEETPAAYAAMDARTALKVAIRP